MRALLNALRSLKAKELPGVAMAPGNIFGAGPLTHTTPVDKPVLNRIGDKRIDDALRHEMGRQRKVVDGTGVDQPMPNMGKAHLTSPADRLTAMGDVLKGDDPQR